MLVWTLALKLKEPFMSHQRIAIELKPNIQKMPKSYLGQMVIASLSQGISPHPQMQSSLKLPASSHTLVRFELNFTGITS